jgi:hypothetical protein
MFMALITVIVYRCTFTKLIEIYALNVYSYIYVNHTSITFKKKKQKGKKPENQEV